MLRLTGTTITLLALLASRETPTLATHSQGGIRELLAAAQGAPAALCGMAARAVGNYNGRWHDAPVTPLGAVQETATDEGRNGQPRLGADDIRVGAVRIGLHVIEVDLLHAEVASAVASVVGLVPF